MDGVASSGFFFAVVFLIISGVVCNAPSRLVEPKYWVLCWRWLESWRCPGHFLFVSQTLDAARLWGYIGDVHVCGTA